MPVIWLVGVERDGPHDSGELCVAAIGAITTVRTGLTAHHDPRLVTDMAEVAVPWTRVGLIPGPCSGVRAAP